MAVVSRQARADLPLLDVLRLLASVAVVHYHVRVEPLFGVGFGLPLFLLVLFGLAAGGAREEGLASFARRKGGYLLVPWLRWSAIYIALFVGVDLLRGVPVGGRFEPQMIFYGGHPALWFLPFAALALLPLHGLRRLARRLPPVPASIAACVLAALATQGVAFALTRDLPDWPARPWLRMAPTLLYGLALGQTLRMPRGRERAFTLVAIALAAVTLYLVSPLGDHAEDLPRRLAVAVPLACVGFGLRVPVPAALRRLSSVTFGVYLVHPLIAKALSELADVHPWSGTLHTTLVWGLACALVLALRARRLGWHEVSPARSAGTGRDTHGPSPPSSVGLGSRVASARVRPTREEQRQEGQHVGLVGDQLEEPPHALR